MKIKLSLIGAGNIGGTMAYLSAIRSLFNQVVLFDINEGAAKGKALDISQSTSVLHSNVEVIGTSDYADIRDSDVIIVTAGVARKPGMSRDDLLDTNTKVIKSVAENIKKYSPNAFVICVTNPLDAMVWVLQQVSGLPENKVVGMAGVLDSARFNYFLAEELKLAVSDVSSFVLGGHGDTMVPFANYVSIGGVPLKSFVEKGKISQAKIDEIVDRTRNGGAEIVKLLGNGSAFFAPATSAIVMAESFVADQKRVFPCAAWVSGAYGVNDLYLGVPAVIGANGVEEVVEISLSEQEKKNLQVSVDSVQELVNICKKFL